MSQNGVRNIEASPNTDALFEQKLLSNGLDKWRILSKFTDQLKDPNISFEPSGMPWGGKSNNA